ncbi:unnamed protein product [Discosporangium mesarthrocarpum]
MEYEAEFIEGTMVRYDPSHLRLAALRYQKKKPMKCCVRTYCNNVTVGVDALVMMSDRNVLRVWLVVRKFLVLCSRSILCSTVPFYVLLHLALALRERMRKTVMSQG